MNDSQARRRLTVEAGGTTVANMRKGTDEELIAWAKARGVFVRIDRGTKWGNPFRLDREADRDHVCDLYRERLDSRPDLLAALPELRGRVLGCWCFPKRCHGNELIEALEAEGETE